MNAHRQAIMQILTEHGEGLLADQGVDPKVAEQIADEILRQTKPKVVIEISGGVCNDVYASAPVDVTVRDFDNIKGGDRDPLDGADLTKSVEYQEAY